MTVYLVRHGQTAFNRDGLGLGREDAPLTEVGVEQADAAAIRLASEHVVRVLSSPLGRAAKMAEKIAVAHGLAVEIREELTELDVGETEGLSFVDMRTRFGPFLAEWAGDNGWQARMPGGESIEDLAARLEPLTREILGEHDGDVVVVSHNFTIRVMLCQLLGISPSRFRAFEVGLASISAVTVRGGRATLRFVNDECHLASLNLA